jgi:hypothetical protein
LLLVTLACTESRVHYICLLAMFFPRGVGTLSVRTTWWFFIWTACFLVEERVYTQLGSTVPFVCGF